MNYIGLSCGHHDATITVLDDSGRVVYTGGTKSSHLDITTAGEARSHIRGDYSLHYYERPWLKNLRRLWSGEGWQWSGNTVGGVVGRDIMAILNPDNKRINIYNHHLSHCGGAFQTSPYSDATGVVIDAIGEWDCSTIWRCWWVDGVARYRLLWRQLYPRSIGLFYSAITRRCGLVPNRDEGRLMRMASGGEARWVKELGELWGHNLHRGCDWLLPDADEVDLAASAQVVAEEWVCDIIKRARRIGDSDNLVYGGGVAFNGVINRRLKEYYNNIWIMGNPGDGGSSLGCAALGWGGRVYTPQTTT
jgi:carbamoyltransferase